MAFFDFFRKSKKTDSYSYRREMAEKICGHHIKYVTERNNEDVDVVIGKSGGLNIRNDELIVFASSDIIMRCAIKDLQAWTLLSNDGVVITAPDLEHGGVERTIIVHYVYYR